MTLPATTLAMRAGTALLAALALSGCARMDRGEADRVPAARTLGQAESCIPIVQIQETRVHDDFTIDFHMAGNRVYRNVLPYRCSGLGFEEAFRYSTSLTQLCSTDIITVISSTGGGVTPRGSCGLGQFQPVELLDERRN